MPPASPVTRAAVVTTKSGLRRATKPTTTTRIPISESTRALPSGRDAPRPRRTLACHAFEDRKAAVRITPDERAAARSERSGEKGAGRLEYPKRACPEALGRDVEDRDLAARDEHR